MQPSLNGIVAQMGGMKFDFSQLGKMMQGQNQDDGEENKINPLLIAAAVGFMVAPKQTMAFLGIATLLKDPLEEQFPGFKKNLEGLGHFFNGHSAQVSFGAQQSPAAPDAAVHTANENEAPAAPVVNKLAHLQSPATKSLIVDMGSNNTDMLGTAADLAQPAPEVSSVQDMQFNRFDMVGGIAPDMPDIAPAPVKLGIFNN